MLHHYEKYYSDPRIVYNRDNNSTEIYLNNYQRRNYDSFIFGNSRSLAFLSSDWRKYIDSDRIFHFDASNESLFGIYKKVVFLSKQNVKIKNCLLIADFDTLKQSTNSKGHIFVKHPVVSGESPYKFQMEFFKTFLNYKFLYGYMFYKSSGKPPAVSNIFETRDFKYDEVSNDVTFIGQDQELVRDLQGYYQKRSNIFFHRDVRKNNPYSPVIGYKQKQMLSEIHNVFKSDNTEYTIVISPLYDQRSLNQQDIAYLKELFGANRVFNYSGVNNFTNELTNYYETSHYRPLVAQQILADIYFSKK